MSWHAVAVRNVKSVSSNDVVCPGGQQECDDGQTCCLLESGSYGCCPYAQVLHNFFLFSDDVLIVIKLSCINVYFVCHQCPTLEYCSAVCFRLMLWITYVQQQQQVFYGLLSGTTQVSRNQKKH